MPDTNTLSRAPNADSGGVTESEVLSWLGSSVVFQGLSSEDLRRFLKGLRIVKFKAGDLVIAEGAVSSSLFVVTHGKFVGRWNQSATLPAAPENPAGRCSEFCKGDCFGEYSLIDRSPASATVTAVEASQALQIVRHSFEAALQSDYRIAKTIYHNMLLLLTARLRAANLT